MEAYERSKTLMAVALGVLLVILWDVMAMWFVPGSFNDKLVVFTAGFATAAVFVAIILVRRQKLT